ncbi:MAG TPA: hypothetical protein VFK05_12510 [Polyangiaceae bacterium]|nr:hypothetical protein [Polyangiaceae bacterium]
MNQSETERAQALTAQMAAPLTAEQLDLCTKMGVTPEVFKAERDRELSEKLPGGAYGLSASERETCKLVGMSEADFAAEKKLLAGG